MVALSPKHNIVCGGMLTLSVSPKKIVTLSATSRQAPPEDEVRVSVTDPAAISKGVGV